MKEESPTFAHGELFIAVKAPCRAPRTHVYINSIHPPPSRLLLITSMVRLSFICGQSLGFPGPVSNALLTDHSEPAALTAAAVRDSAESRTDHHCRIAGGWVPAGGR